MEQDRKLNQCLLKHQLSEKGAQTLDPENLLGPILPLPRALIGKDRLPYKATKSSTTKYIKKRYSTVALLKQNLPNQWVPNTTILEGKFMIQTSPHDNNERVHSPVYP